MTTEINFQEDSTTREGREAILDAIISSSPDMAGKNNDRICWNYYNNKIDPAKFDYLRKSGRFEYPAKVRRIPKQRPYIDNLVSQQSQRPFAFSVYGIDDEFISKKYDTIVRGMLEMTEQKATEAYFTITSQLEQLNTQRQQIEQYMQQEPQNDQQKQAYAAMQQAYPKIKAQIEMLKVNLMKQSRITQDDMDKLDQFYRYKYRDTAEIIAQKAVRKLRQDLNIPYKEVHGVRHRCVTGKEYYMVDYIPGNKLPTFEVLNGMKVFAPASDNATWIQDGPWVRLEEGMNMDQILAEFGVYLDSDDMQAMKSMSPISPGVENGNFIATRNGAVLRDTVKGVYSGSGGAGNYVVNKVWWRAPRIISAKKAPNPYNPDMPFTHFIPTNKTIIHEADFRYEQATREWVSKANPDVRYKASEVETINKAKGEYVKSKTVYDRYKGFVIGNSIKKTFKDPIQPRPYTDLSHVLLPVVGRMHNTTTDAPYSLIWNTIDLQETYDLIHYHRELLLALSGVSGLVMDLAQKPESMDPDEWFYHMKMGRYLIETVTKTGRKNFAFNQFPRVDQSLNASIQYLDQMLRSVDESMGMVMGVTRQRLGQTVNSDQVGTFEMSRNLSMLTTEVIFREHDETVRQALTQCLNMAMRYCWDAGAMLQLVDQGIEYFAIPPKVLSEIEFYVRVENNTQEQFNLDELRKIGMGMSMKGQVSFKEFVSIYNSTSVRELEMKLEYLAKQAQEMMDMRSQTERDFESAIEDRKQKFQVELEKIRLESEERLKTFTEKMKDAQGRAKLALEQEMFEFEKQKWEDERALTINEQMNLAGIESRKIDSAEKTNALDNHVKLLVAQMNQLVSMAKIGSDHQMGNKQIAVDRMKAEKSGSSND